MYVLGILVFLASSNLVISSSPSKCDHLHLVKLSQSSATAQVYKIPCCYKGLSSASAPLRIAQVGLRSTQALHDVSGGRALFHFVAPIGLAVSVQVVTI